MLYKHTATGMIKPVPYQIKLDDGRYIFAHEDSDHCVRAFGTTEKDYIVHDMVHDVNMYVCIFLFCTRYPVQDNCGIITFTIKWTN